MKRLMFHLPLIAMLSILGFFALVDMGHLSGFRNESTFGWMVGVWYPLCALLGLVQIVLWIAWLVRRGVPRPMKRGMSLGLWIAGAAVLGLFALQIARRWGMFE